MISDKPQRMLDTEKDDGHFSSGDGRFFRDDRYFFFYVGQIFFHVGQKFSNVGPIVENVGQSHAMLDDFFQIWNDPVEMLDRPSRKPKGMSNVLPNMSNKRYRCLNIVQKMQNISGHEEKWRTFRFGNT